MKPPAFDSAPRASRPMAAGGWIPVTVLLSLAGCAAPPTSEQTPAPAAVATTSVTTVMSPISINAEMVKIIDHAAHQLWNAEREGMKPKTDTQWEVLEEHAMQIAAAGALIRLEGTGVNDRDWVQLPDWQKWSKAVSDAGLAGLKAIAKRDHPGLVAANGQLVEACEGCHKHYKPALPSEGISHPHLH